MPDMFANAIGYEQLMGRWSVRLAPLYAEFARLRDFGTRETEIVGVDPAQSFIDYARTRFSDRRWTQGSELVTFYESSSGTHRGFCRVCGSPLLSRFDFEPSFYGLPLGALDDDPGVKPKRHVFVAHKASWYDIADDLPQFPELPPKAP